MAVIVRRVVADEWSEVKALRLEALQDEAAPIAFLETYDGAIAEADDFWQRRAADASEGSTVAQFIAADRSTGHWIGTVAGLREEPGTDDFEGQPVEQLQAHVVGVWVHPDHRGAGLFESLLAAVTAWAVEHGVDRLRLYVHANNRRARATYRRCGFIETGRCLSGRIGEEIEMVRALLPRPSRTPD